MSWADRYSIYLDAALMARANARVARRMAKQWPQHFEREMADASAAYARGIRYLDVCRECRWRIAQYAEVEYADAA